MTAHDMTASITCAGCQHSYSDVALFCPNCGRPKVREATGDALVGKLLGERFQVHELIGQGGSGTIYRAEHITLRRKVAIKVLHNELSRDDLAVERFRREATTVAEIDNEHIVEIHDFGRTPDGRLYLAMELLEGETLDAVIAREGQMSVERTADILSQVGEALMEAHAIGYVHRDLRPRNLYLAVRRGKANFVKLLDFGLAKLVESESGAASTSLGMTFGDPRYMSPEQARGDRIDRRADIYQLGCIAYEMLSGTPPFTGNRVFDILTKQVTETPTPLPSRRPGVPLWMEAAVAKMLAKDPENRFATTTRMVEALRRGLETGEVMEDEVARRRESIPPPSVSRVMQKMGMLPESDAAPAPKAEVAPKAEAPKPAPAAQTPSTPKAVPAPVNPPRTKSVTNPPVARDPAFVAGSPAATLQGTLSPKRDEVAAASGSSLPKAEPEESRRRTGTPRVGVPIVKDPAKEEVQPAVAGTIEPRSDSSITARSESRDEPRAKRSSSNGKDPLGVSEVWFDEGEEDDRPARGRRSSLSSTSTHDFYDETEPPKKRWALLGTLLAVAAIGGTIAFAVSRNSGSTTHEESSASAAAVAQAPPTPPPPTPSTEVAPSEIIQDPGKPVEQTKVDPPKVDPPKVDPPKTEVAKPAAKATDKPADKTTAKRVAIADPKALAEDLAGRRPGGLGTPPPPPPTPVVVTPPAPKDPAGVSGTDKPVDPYAPAGDPGDGATNEKKAEFFANLGGQQLASGDIAGAAGNFKKAIDLDPKNLTAVMGQGEIALRQGAFGDAIAHLTKASKLAPKSSKVFTLLGEAYLSSGQNPLAAANFKKALQLDPDNARARDGYNEAQSRVPPPTDE
jgi:tRNA A-37 threonylcarbamoyl transferase component Bud32